ncbi:YkuJ family protein [Metabacillus sp. GX 13764]|uniref:YkuJ family protein n=1 Tax=Metabacillus kandeliae TaxID=2900151 RepID=UPI001E3BF6C0|nr:YkuJ family protein [Metabacillus kandeliae]MCD7035469.1 YkuJ family protein [Metabacillus kandeliae]
MSQLLGIIQRLQSLQETATGSEPSQRFFEVEGEKRCSVKYFDKSGTYELEVFEKGEKPQSFQFDNIDIIAIEIFDLLQQ